MKIMPSDTIVRQENRSKTESEYHRGYIDGMDHALKVIARIKEDPRFKGKIWQRIEDIAETVDNLQGRK